MSKNLTEMYRTLLNSVMLKWYISKDYFNQPTFKDMVEGRLPKSVFALKLLQETADAISKVSGIRGPKYPPPDANIKQFQANMLDMNLPLHQKNFRKFDQDWLDGKFKMLSFLITSPQNMRGFYTWLMTLKFDSRFYKKLLKKHRTKTLKDLVLLEFSKNQTLLNKRELTEKFKELVQLLYKKDIVKAEKIFRELIDKDPLVPIYWNAGFSIYALKKEYKKALQCLRVSVSLNPYDIGIWKLCLGCYNSMKNINIGSQLHEKKNIPDMSNVLRNGLTIPNIRNRVPIHSFLSPISRAISVTRMTAINRWIDLKEIQETGQVLFPDSNALTLDNIKDVLLSKINKKEIQAEFDPKNMRVIFH
ncbi:MAG: tetratricopeptide repeat protein [Promethearchaeota archaeon]